MLEIKPVIGLSWQPKVPDFSTEKKIRSGHSIKPHNQPESSVFWTSNSKLVDGLFVPPNNPRELNKLVTKQLKDTMGCNWFEMLAPIIIPKLKKDHQLLKLRSALDPKRHYKKGDSKSKALPKSFQVCIEIESAMDFFNGRLTEKERKATLANELFSDPTPNVGAQQCLIMSELMNRTCSTMLELRQYHSQIIKFSLSSNNDAMGRIIKFCSISKNGDLGYALQVFATIPHPDAFIYNTIMRGYLQAHLVRSCILFYLQMLQESITPNRFTFPVVIRACSIHNSMEEGKQLHAHIFKFGHGEHSYSQNNLIYMYVNFQSLEEARRVFDKMPTRDVVSWTSLITGYSQWGSVDEAFEIFEAMPERNSISWNAMIAAYVQSNRFHEAFGLFDHMRAENVSLDKFVAASMLSACTSLGALEQGKWIHEYINKNGIEMDPKLATTIIDMYCKCGCLEKAFEVFNRLDDKGISSWNCMIGGLAIHGKGKDAINLFKKMEREMITPDHITFVNLLSACAHSGFVEEGRYYFHYMVEVHGIEIRMEHYGCMVDLLGRAGLLEEAKEMIKKMPMNPDVDVLGALLAACKIYGSIELGEEIGKKVIELEPDNSGRYVLLANLYANAGRWEDVAKIRKLMNDRRVNKAAGVSIIEIQGVVNEFIAGGTGNPEAKQIYGKLDEMLQRIRCFGYVPDSQLDEEEDQHNPLYYHSEKLAIAYGLLKTKAGETIRISKNLRVCKDCHNASKLISKVYDCQIIVRDRHRFHHFKMGHCSCNDYW